MSNIFFNYLLLITRGSPFSLLNNPNVKLIRFNQLLWYHLQNKSLANN